MITLHFHSVLSQWKIFFQTKIISFVILHLKVYILLTGAKNLKNFLLKRLQEKQILKITNVDGHFFRLINLIYKIETKPLRQNTL